jgi:hypothetical protein
MADDVYISGLGPGVPEWSNEATQQQVLNALNSGFSSNTQVNRQIMSVLSSMSREESESSDKLSILVNGIKKNESAIKKGNTIDASNTNANKKQTGFLASLINILSVTNTTAKKQLDITKLIAEYEKQGLSAAQANLRANIETSKLDPSTMYSDGKEVIGKIMAAVGFVSTANSKTIEGGTNRFNMAQEMRQSGILAGMDSAGAGLIGLSKTISRSNFTFGEAAEFTRKFSQAVGVRGVQASYEFANTLAKSGEGNSDMMNRYGMVFSEVVDIAGTYMESVRSIGQLDKLSDDQMRMGMDNFMDTVVSTSNVMKINLQDAANMIAETLKQDQFASQLALMEPQMRKSVEAMVGRFGGEGTILGSGIATAMAAGSTQDFLQTDVAQQLQGDVVGQKLLPLITQMAETARTQGPEAANALYANMGPQFDAIIQFARENKSLVNLNEGMVQAIVTQLASMRQTVADADKGTVEPSKEDKAVITLLEAQRFATVVSEANETLVLNAAELSKSLGQLVESSLILTRETAQLGAETSSFRGGVRSLELSLATIANMTAAGAAQAAQMQLPRNMDGQARTGVDPSTAADMSSGQLLTNYIRRLAGLSVSDDDINNVEELNAKKTIVSLDGDFNRTMIEMTELLKTAPDPEKLGKQFKNSFRDMLKDDSWWPGNYFNSDEVKEYNKGIEKLIAKIDGLVNNLQ